LGNAENVFNKNTIFDEKMINYRKYNGLIGLLCIITYHKTAIYNF